MDEREYREQPVAQPTGQWMVPSDRMILHRYKSMEHFDSVLENGFRAARAEDHERREDVPRNQPANMRWKRCS